MAKPKTCETQDPLFLLLSIVISSPSSSSFPSFSAAACALLAVGSAGMLTLAGQLKGIALRKAADPQHPLRASPPPTARVRMSVLSFIICSIDHRMYYVCRGSVSAPRDYASLTGRRGKKNPNSRRDKSLVCIRQFKKRLLKKNMKSGSV